MRRRLQELKDEADGGTGMLVSNLTVIDGREAKPPDITGPAMSVPFLAARRLVVVDNLLERYDWNPEQRQQRPLTPWEPLFSALEAGIPDSTILVFTGPGVSRRNPMAERLRKIPGVSDEEYPELKGDALTRYVKDEAAARGVRFKNGPSKERHIGSDEWEHAGLHDRRGAAPTDPVELLKILVQGDTLSLANELDKLALYTMGRDVTVDDVYEVSAGARDFDAFAFTDAVMDGELAKALHVMARLRDDGTEDAGLLAILLGAYRRLAPVVDLVEQGATPEEIGAAMGNAGKYANLRDRAINRARRLGSGGLRRAYEVMIEADRTSKTGEVKDDIALEIAVMRLATLVPESATGRR